MLAIFCIKNISIKADFNITKNEYNVYFFIYFSIFMI